MMVEGRKEIYQPRSIRVVNFGYAQMSPIFGGAGEEMVAGITITINFLVGNFIRVKGVKVTVRLLFRTERTDPDREVCLLERGMTKDKTARCEVAT